MLDIWLYEGPPRLRDVIGIIIHGWCGREREELI